ncbi:MULTISPECIES: CHAD domain-containing protein [unclassified Thioalkalivibrio]|uniref:CHAD domain-containing protein n=1 Tax=unclassified Thioalkalivibrio TaxID=2621013 RepID=UPI0003743995|nr:MULTISPECIES: CHAD domain-containing protein [unclassified Thioalkalivibrio]
MAFEFERRESVSAGVRRVAREEMSSAEAELLDVRMPADRAVHETRKRLKRLRALLRLVEPQLPRQDFRDTNRTLRDLGRALSGARDSAVILATLRDLATAPGAPSIESLHGYLAEQYGAGQAGDDQLAAQRQEVAAVLQELQSGMAALPLRGKGFALIAPGLEKTYRRGREALRVALLDRDDECWHAWRKRAKAHWIQMRLLRPMWPEMMKSQDGALEALSDRLGDDHDLTVVDVVLAGLPEGVMAPEAIATLRDRIAERKASLRARVIPLGQRLYAEKPKALRKRLHAYWRVWRP